MAYGILHYILMLNAETDIWEHVSCEYVSYSKIMRIYTYSFHSFGLSIF
jgi:hypothetical protein